MRISITPEIAIDEKEVREQFVRSPGPGGQNVNKVSTAVQLRFDALNSPSLPADVGQRLRRLAGKKMMADGVLVIVASRFRTRERNRLDAMDRLTKLIRKAAERPRPRRKTSPTAASRARRLESKAHRSTIKRSRGAVTGE